ncbi:MAG: hypothetical protein Q8S21_02405 [Candidatus Paracaedibacteraceae bacterium]|nr:hypothetical protein [Candidatus Paracaedibacteraceae bacterium]
MIINIIQISDGYASVKITVPPGSIRTYASIANNPSNPGVTLEKIGLGSLVTLDNAFTGKALVSEGSWFVVGSATRAGLNNGVSVAMGATLAGPGPIHGDISNAGILSPSGGGIIVDVVGNVETNHIAVKTGTVMNVIGNYSQPVSVRSDQYGGLLFCVSPSNCDAITFTGTVDLTYGTLSVSPSPGFYFNTEYTIMIANSIILPLGGGPQPINTSSIPFASMTADYSTPGKIKLLLTGARQTVPVMTNTVTTVIQNDDGTTSTITTTTTTADVSQFLNISGPATIVNGTILNNLSGSSNEINVPISFGENSGDSITINTSNNTDGSVSTTNLTMPLTGVRGTTVRLTGGHDNVVAISSDNRSTLNSDVIVDNITLSVLNGGNIGNGKLIIASNSATSTVRLASINLPNPISMSAAATFSTPTGTTSALQGEITGSAPMTFKGDGKTVIGGTDKLYASNNYTGSINAVSGEVAVNSDMPQTDVFISQDATYSGTGTAQNVYHYGVLKPGNSIGTTNIVGNYSAGGSYTGNNADIIAGENPIYLVEINAAGESNLINVTGNTTITGTYNINILMDRGNYSLGSSSNPTTHSNPISESNPIVIGYNILQTGGVLTIDPQAKYNVSWVSQPGLSFVVGRLDHPTSPLDGKSLILKLVSTEPINISDDQTISNADASVLSSYEVLGTHTLNGINYYVIEIDNSNVTIGANDVVSSKSGILPSIEQPDHTAIVFNTNRFDQTGPTIDQDAFRFKKFRSAAIKQVGRNDRFESLLMAISQNGPVSYEQNETRLWITPYINRSRTHKTSSDAGNQGWSGGSLIGLEKRDIKNTWSLGLVGGVMGSRSHVIGDADTFSKTKGVLFGMFNTYKYAKKWGHELLATRTITYIDGQRFDKDSTTKIPYYAISSYKTITDVGNAQINYLFDIVKKKYTCRLSSGATHQKVVSGRYLETNADKNNLLNSGGENQTFEWYSGIGLRKITDIDNITIRTTFVYEYGYSVFSKGSVSTIRNQSFAPTTFIAPIGPRQNKHYLQLNTSYLDHSTGIKFIASYFGSFYKNVENHAFMFKAEYRF